MRARFLILIGTICVTAVLGVAPAAATPTNAPILIREFSPEIGGDPTAEFVMLQMTVPGQQHVAGEALTFYGPSGAVTGTYVLPSDVPNGQTQATILMATPQAAAQFGFPTLDFTLPTGDSLNPSGGALCFSGPAFIPDCATWGIFPDITTQIGASIPNPQFLNASKGGFMWRAIATGCPTWLDPMDDTDNSEADFFDGDDGLGELPLQPRRNTDPTTESPCKPDTIFNQTPGNPTNDSTPTFAFAEAPPEYPETVSFECRLGPGSSLPGGLAWSACAGSGSTYGPLSDGIWTFEAKASGQGGEDLSPASWTFEVDTVPPQTFIDSVPPEPSNGFSATFSFHSNEAKAKFQCQFESGQIQPCEPGKTLFSLSDGPHVFRVWAIDQATNVDPTPAVVTFNVDTTLGDKSAPDASILSHPNNPSSTGRAVFTYRSNEPRSTFQCSLDGAPFSACEVAGTTYPRLKNGSHAFKVRAIDRAGNVDAVPASFSWTIRAPLPDTRITTSPPGFQRIKSGAKALKVSFAFQSNEPKSDFLCRLDKGEFKPCKSPKKLKAPSGRHRFEVYATDAVGNVEAVPARRIFRIGSAGHKGFFRPGGVW